MGGSAVDVTKAACQPWQSCHDAYRSEDLRSSVHLPLAAPRTASAVLGGRIASSRRNNRDQQFASVRSRRFFQCFDAQQVNHPSFMDPRQLMISGELWDNVGGMP